MAFKNFFEELWSLDWGVGIFFKEVKNYGSYFHATGEINHIYFNFVSPLITDFSKINLPEIESRFKQSNTPPAFYLLESHQKAGFIEHLIRADYKYDSSETYMGYDSNSHTHSKANNKITEINIDTFKDFRLVLGEVFKDFSSNEQYLDLCKKTLSKEILKSDIQSKFYLIYNANVPVSGAGLFYSQKSNFAYLHNDGTLESSRNKGYQTDLINHRVQQALDFGITRIYSIVEPGSKSWSNYIKCGFNQMQTLVLLKK